MNKKIIIAVVSVVLVLAIAASGTYIWAANHPNFCIVVLKPVTEPDKYIEYCEIGYSQTLGIPAFDKRIKEYSEIDAAMNTAYDELRKEYDTPTHLELDFTKAEDGGTIAAYHGTVTKDGVTSEFNRQWNFNFKYVEPKEYN